MTRVTVDETHIRHCMLYEFRQGKKAIVATKNITDVYGNDALDVRKCQRWFKRFKTGDLSLEDDHRPGRPIVFDDDALSALLKAEPNLSTEELAMLLNSTTSTVHRHLKALGLTNTPSKNLKSEGVCTLNR